MDIYRAYKRSVRKIHSITNALAAVMVLIIFLIFCANVIMRYTIGVSFGWIVELSLILWLWVIFFGAGIYLEDRDQVSFMFMSKLLNKKTSANLKAMSYAIVIAGFIIMIPATWDYLKFLRIKESNVIGIPMSQVYSVYKTFLIATIIRYTYKLGRYAFVSFRFNQIKNSKGEIPQK